MKFNNDNLIIDPNDKILRVKCSDVTFPLSDEDRETALGLREYVYMSTFSPSSNSIYTTHIFLVIPT